MATKITGVLTGDKNNACNTCSCGNLVLPTGPPGPSGATGPTGPTGPAGPPGVGDSVLIKHAQYFNIANGGIPAPTPGTWTDLFTWTMTPLPGEVYNADGGGFRLEWTGMSCAFEPRDPDLNVTWRVYNDTTSTEIYKTGQSTPLPDLIDFPVQKHRMVMAWDVTNERWGGRVEIIAGDLEGDACYNEDKLFTGNIKSGLAWDKLGIGGFGLLRPLDRAFSFPDPQTFKIQYDLSSGLGRTIKLSEFLAEFIPAPT